MEEIKIIEIISVVISSGIFKTAVGLSFAGVTTWASLIYRKIKKAPTGEEFKKGIEEAKNYADEKMQIHEDKQNLELTNITQKIDETHDMVGKLLDIQLNIRS